MKNHLTYNLLMSIIKDLNLDKNNKYRIRLIKAKNSLQKRCLTYRKILNLKSWGRKT